MIYVFVSAFSDSLFLCNVMILLFFTTWLLCKFSCLLFVYDRISYIDQYRYYLRLFVILTEQNVVLIFFFFCKLCTAELIFICILKSQYEDATFSEAKKICSELHRGYLSLWPPKFSSKCEIRVPFSLLMKRL